MERNRTSGVGLQQYQMPMPGPKDGRTCVCRNDDESLNQAINQSVTGSRGGTHTDSSSTKLLYTTRAVEGAGKEI